ncbi:MAG TPA: GNAT family N-acetyltransferase [Acidimicrobiia bacterium]|nr:GNAT family N-acetyltransferase [Acidimicrobiia bacterium]
MSEYDIRAVEAAAAQGLRHAVLDPRASTDRFQDVGDEAPSTLHLGGFRGEHLAGVASIARRRSPDETGGDAWRLHGVAIEHGHRGWGLGAQLLERCLEHAAVHQARLVWCDTPAGTFGFFERFGFHRVGDPFTVGGIPHYRMAVRFLASEPR